MRGPLFSATYCPSIRRQVRLMRGPLFGGRYGFSAVKSFALLQPARGRIRFRLAPPYKVAPQPGTA